MNVQFRKDKAKLLNAMNKYFKDLRKTYYFKSKRKMLEGTGKDELMLEAYITLTYKLWLREYKDWGTRAMPERRIKHLNNIIDDVWKNVDKGSLPEYIRGKTKDGRPVEELQKVLFVLVALNPDTYNYLERNKVRIVLVKTNWFASRTSGDRFFGLVSKDPRGAKIAIREQNHTLKKVGTLIHEKVHHEKRGVPRNLWQLYLKTLGMIKELFRELPSYEEEAFEAQKRFIREKLFIDVRIKDLSLEFLEQRWIFGLASIGVWIITLMPFYLLIEHVIKKRRAAPKRPFRWKKLKIEIKGLKIASGTGLTLTALFGTGALATSGTALPVTLGILGGISLAYTMMQGITAFFIRKAFKKSGTDERAGPIAEIRTLPDGTEYIWIAPEFENLPKFIQKLVLLHEKTHLAGFDEFIAYALPWIGLFKKVDYVGIETTNTPFKVLSIEELTKAKMFPKTGSDPSLISAILLSPLFFATSGWCVDKTVTLSQYNVGLGILGVIALMVFMITTMVWPKRREKIEGDKQKKPHLIRKMLVFVKDKESGKIFKVTIEGAEEKDLDVWFKKERRFKRVNWERTFAFVREKRPNKKKVFLKAIYEDEIIGLCFAHEDNISEGSLYKQDVVFCRLLEVNDPWKRRGVGSQLLFGTASRIMGKSYWSMIDLKTSVAKKFIGSMHGKMIIGRDGHPYNYLSQEEVKKLLVKNRFKQTQLEKEKNVQKKTEETQLFPTAITIGVVGVSEDMINNINKEIAGVRLVALNEGTKKENLEALERARITYRAYASGIIESDITDEAELRNIVEELVSAIEQEDIRLFALANPEIAKLNQETIKKIENIDQTLQRIVERIPIIRSMRTSQLSIYNMRMASIAQKTSFASLTPKAISYIKDNKEERIISIGASSLGEVKLLAEAHKKRMNLAKRLNPKAVPLRLQVRLTVKEKDTSKINENTRQGLLKRMEIDDVLDVDDLIL
ncbi:MAG: hypothetical protein KAU58_00005, partial [Candidatus Omnitrophica bacterium]|nr:hypothetical protein [Candidatus Omnitrophota bacterium]